MKGVFFFLGELNDEDIDWMIKHGQKQHLASGATLVQEGKPLDKMHLILDGAFGFSAARLGGREVSKMGVGEVIGEVSFIDSRPPSGTVTARLPSVVLSIPLPKLAAKLREDFGFAARFYRALSMMLAYRLREQINLPAGADPAAEPSDQLDMNVLDTVHLAGARFQRILARLHSI
jgi:CRP/FNR family transcriptional regulator, cyclic AMP receptor protein